MPLNEAGVIRRSNLTKAQKREAEAAIYGLSIERMPQNLSEQDIATMRAILAQHDQRQSPINEFDLNNPPKKPYVFQDYPRALYNHDSRTHRIVANAGQEKSLQPLGYVREPFPTEIPEPELDSEEAPEAAAAEATRLKNLKKGK